MADRPSPNRLWHFSLSAKASGMSAHLQVRSANKARKKAAFSFFSSRKTSSRHVQEAGCLTALPDMSLRIRAQFFLLRVKVAAGRLRELGLETWRPGKLKDVMKPLPSAPRSHVFKGLFGRPSSVLSCFLFARKQRKGSVFACGAGLGAFVLLILHHANTWATHLPVFALNAGSCVVSFLLKSLRQKCANGASPFWQGLRNVATLFQMALSILRSTVVTKRFMATALLIALVGLVMMGKANKSQEFLDKRRRTGADRLAANLLMRLLMVMKLVKSFWTHTSLIHMLLFVLLSAILSNGMSRVAKFF